VRDPRSKIRAFARFPPEMKNVTNGRDAREETIEPGMETLDVKEA
jgi:hypothetical protein